MRIGIETQAGHRLLATEIGRRPTFIKLGVPVSETEALGFLLDIRERDAIRQGGCWLALADIRLPVRSFQQGVRLGAEVQIGGEWFDVDELPILAALRAEDEEARIARIASGNGKLIVRLLEAQDGDLQQPLGVADASDGPVEVLLAGGRRRLRAIVVPESDFGTAEELVLGGGVVVVLPPSEEGVWAIAGGR